MYYDMNIYGNYVRDRIKATVTAKNDEVFKIENVTSVEVDDYNHVVTFATDDAKEQAIIPVFNSNMLKSISIEISF